jgi:hypothetical protein
MELSNRTPQAFFRLVRFSIVAACISALLIAPYACWAGDDDDDDQQTSSATLDNMRTMMQMMQNNQDVLDSVRARVAAQQQEQANRNSAFEEQIRERQQAQADRIAAYQQQLSQQQAQAATRVVSTYDGSGGLQKIYFPGMNQCIRRIGDDTLANSCNVAATVNWSDEGVCHDYSCMDIIPPGGEIRITTVHGTFHFGACRADDRSISITWNAEHTQFSCWRFRVND